MRLVLTMLVIGSFLLSGGSAFAEKKQSSGSAAPAVSSQAPTKAKSMKVAKVSKHKKRGKKKSAPKK